MKPIRLAAAAAGVVLMLAAGVPAGAAEIKVICSNALKTALEQLAPAFEKATEHKLAIIFGATIPLKADIEKGAMFDVAILATDAVDNLTGTGRLAAATRTELANSSAGMAVRKGAPKPDISTVEAFKKALLDAKSVAYVEQGATGVYLKTLLPRLGIADSVQPKLKLLPPENPAAKAIANGEAEIGMTQISEILPYAGAELVGPLPTDIQLTMSFGGAVAANAAQPDAARALLKFLKGPEAAAVFKAKGLDPAG
jgi:molybdate transport system substrate-binding protein